MEGFSVNIVYRDKDMNKTNEVEYSLKEYSEAVRFELMSLLMDIEKIAEYQSGSKDKNDWNEEALKAFNKVRHKILDEANSVGRLPENLMYNGRRVGTVSSGQAIADIVNALTR